MAKVESIGVVVDGQKKRRKKKQKKTDERTRRTCEHCGKRTDYMCLGWRRVCCFSAASAKKNNEKHPKNFSVKTPILNRKTGALRRVRRSSDLVHENSVCQWTCYHALHREAWETYTESNKHQILAMARGNRSEANTKKKGMKKKKKGKLKTIKEGKDEDNSVGESEEEDVLSDSGSDEESDSESDEESDSESDEESDSDDENDQHNGRKKAIVT